MKPNSKSQAGTKADSKQKDENLFVGQHNAKPHVARSFCLTNNIDVIISLNTLFIAWAMCLLLVCFLISLSLSQYFVIESLKKECQKVKSDYFFSVRSQELSK